MADLHSERDFLDWLLKDVPDIKFVEKNPANSEGTGRSYELVELVRIKQ